METNTAINPNLESLPEVSEILLSEKQIQERIQELGIQISRDYSGKVPIAIAVLRGAAIFHADLIRCISVGVKIDFISVSSYQASTASSGMVRILKNVELDLTGKDVILVEDIVDTGLTVNFLIQKLERHKPASIRVCSLLSKPDRRKVDVPIDYLGFEVPNRFVVGFGMDIAERYRNLPFIGILKDSITGISI